MRVFLFLLLSGGLAAAQIASPVETAAMKRGRKLIEEAVAALGGENFLALKNKVEKGRVFSFRRQRVSGLSWATIYTRYLVAPPRPEPGALYLRERQAFGKNESWAVLFNEFGAWEVTYRGARPLSRETIDRFRESRRRDIFYILLRRLNEEGLVIEDRGTDIVDNRPMRAVDITDAENRVVKVYLDYSTRLPLREVYSRRDEDRVPHQEVSFFDKYRDVGGGVKLPFVIQRERDGERAFSMYADSVLINQDLTDEIFTLPGGMKMLPPAK